MTTRIVSLCRKRNRLPGETLPFTIEESLKRLGLKRLSPIFPNEAIDATDGTEAIGVVFTLDVDGWSDKNPSTKPSKPTPITPFAVYEMIKDRAGAENFGALGENLQRQLCWTKAQIVVFCRSYRDYLCGENGHGALFLYETEGSGFSVIHMEVGCDRLCGREFLLGYGNMRISNYALPIVVPGPAVSSVAGVEDDGTWYPGW